jgi:alpha-glucoside transport system substrate-binding protein
MFNKTHRNLFVAVGGLAVLATALVGCSSGPGASANVGNEDGVVTVYGSLTGSDATLLEQSWAAWQDKNHITIKYEGSTDFQEQIGTRAQQGNAPDLAIFEQPGLLTDLAKLGYLKAAPSAVATEVTKNFSTDWTRYATVDGKIYGSPLLATVNGYIWYSPRQFSKWGLKTPKTYAELYGLAQQIQQKENAPAWCDGFSSGATSGAAGTDWLEDVVLRKEGAAVYDKWTTHGIPFTDARITDSFAAVGEMIGDPTLVNGGLGDKATINTSTTEDVAKALASGKCALTHQSSAFDGLMQDPDVGNTSVGANDKIWAFMMPGFGTGTTPITGGGDYVAAFSNDSDTQKVQAYLASAAWANSRVSLGGVISANKGLSAFSATSPILRQSIQLLKNPKTVFRFDASDIMPSTVGSGTFLTGMVHWIDGEDAKKVQKTIEASWPDN